MTCKPVGNGLVGDSYRFGLTYEDLAYEEDEPEAPASVNLKCSVRRIFGSSFRPLGFVSGLDMILGVPLLALEPMAHLTGQNTERSRNWTARSGRLAGLTN